MQSMEIIRRDNMRFYRVHVQCIDEDLKCNNHMFFDFKNSGDALSFAQDAHEANANYDVWIQIMDNENQLPEWRVI